MESVTDDELVEELQKRGFIVFRKPDCGEKESMKQYAACELGDEL